MRKSARARFWEKVFIPTARDACWEWQGYRSTGGYGRMVLKDRKCGYELAHRLAWVFSRGPIPDGLCVLHACDNVICVNPKHLFLGTDADNMHDRKAKGRYAIGDANASIKVTDAQVREIRALIRPSYRAVAEQYGISAGHVKRLRMRRWRALVPDVAPPA